ncbi:MAG: PEGA domain-containing protein, partial [Oleiharenicola lentus]
MMRLLARSALVLFAICAATASAHAVTLVVKATPAGATVAIDGKTLPAPGTFDLKRREEPYLIIISKPGYQTETTTFSTKQKLKEISVDLQPLTLDREVTIKSIPDGATVTIGGSAAGTTPFAKTVTFIRGDKSAPWQLLTVTLSKADYQSESFRLAAETPAPPPVTLAQLRLERTFLVSAKTGDNTPVEAVL